MFITKEIFRYADVGANIGEELKAEVPEAERVEMLDTLHKRVTQHNIQVVSGYYGRIAMERLAQLLGLDLSEMEKQLCDMVTKKQVYARIDRPAGVISFSPPRTPNELLNDWSSDISELLKKLESTCHLIHKENMVHKIV